MKKGITIVFIIVMLVSATGLAVAAGQAESEPDVLTVAYPQDVATFDIMTTTAPPNEVRHMVFEPLFAPDIGLQPQPHLVEDWEVSDDDLTWTFTLRDDITFHDGEQMTAADVEASFDRYRQVGARAWEYERVDDVVATGDLTFEFRLNSPFGALLETLAPTSGVFAIYPEWVVEEVGSDDLTNIDHIVGSGPYTVEEIVPEERVVLRRFADYAQPGGEPSFLAGNRNAPIETIEVVVIEDHATRVAALEAGDVDLIQNVPLDDASRVENNPNTNITVTSPGYRVYYKFNTTRPPFDDPLLREAVRTAIDTEELMLAIGDSEYWRVNHTMRYQEEQWMWSDVAWDYYDGPDLERARELVEQSDYDGEEVRFLSSPGRDLEFRTVIPMQEVLQDIGINTRIFSVDAATFSQVRAELDEWEIKHAGGGSMVGLAYLNSSAQDRTGEFWPNVPDEWHELMEQVVVDTDRSSREAAVERLHELHAETNNELWLGDVFELAGARNNISNVPPWFKLILWNIEKD